MSWLFPDKQDSFLKPKKARGGSFLKPDTKREEATERVHGETYLRDAIHHLQHQPEVLKAKHEQEMATTAASIASVKATEKLTNVALSMKTDVSTHNQMLLMTHETTEYVRKISEAEKIRIENYEKEKNIDVKTAVGLKMVPFEELIYVAARIEEIKTQQLLPPGMIQRLEVLRDQMAGHLLEKGDGQDLQAINSASDSPAGD